MNLSSLPQRLDTLIRFFLYLMIFWLPYSKAAIEMCVIINSLLFIFKRIILIILAFRAPKISGRSKNIFELIKLPDSPLNEPIFIFLIFACVSTVTSVSLSHSVAGLFRKTMEWFAIYFFMIEAMKEEKHVWMGVKVFIFSAAAVVLDSFVQFYWLKRDIFNGYPNLDNRATASFQHSNSLAAYLCFVLPVCVSCFFLCKKMDRKSGVALGLLSILAFWSFFLTFSRGAWISIFAASSFWIFFFNGRLRNWMVFFCILGLFSLAIFFTISGKEVRLDPNNVNYTISWRSSLWLDSLRMLMERPLFGFGPNTFMSAFQSFGSEFRGKAFYQPTYAHNCYIQIAVEYGILGFSSFLWILIETFRFCWDYFKKSTNKKLRVLSLGIFTGLGAFLFHSFVDTHFFVLQLTALFWYVLGLQMKIIQLRNSEQFPPPHDQ